MITSWPCLWRYRKSGVHASQQPNYFTSSTVTVLLPTSASNVSWTPFRHKAYWCDQSTHFVRILIIQVDVSPAPRASHFVHHHVVARPSLALNSLSMKLPILVSSVSKLVHMTKNCSLSHRHIYSSNILHLQQQLDCLVYSDIFGHCKNSRYLGEDLPPCYACWSFSRDYAQSAAFYKITYQIAPPPFSRLGTCGASYSLIANEYVSLLVHVLVCWRI